MSEWTVGRPIPVTPEEPKSHTQIREACRKAAEGYLAVQDELHETVRQIPVPEDPIAEKAFDWVRDWILHEDQDEVTVDMLAFNADQPYAEVVAEVLYGHGLGPDPHQQ